MESESLFENINHSIDFSSDDSVNDPNFDSLNCTKPSSDSENDIVSIEVNVKHCDSRVIVLWKIYL